MTLNCSCQGALGNRVLGTNSVKRFAQTWRGTGWDGISLAQRAGREGGMVGLMRKRKKVTELAAWLCGDGQASPPTKEMTDPQKT